MSLAILAVLLIVRDVCRLDPEGLGHYFLDILGIKLRIGLLLVVWLVNRQELDFDSIQRVRQQVPKEHTKHIT